MQDFVKEKVAQLQRDFVDKLIAAQTVNRLIEQRMSTSSELNGTTLEVRTIEVLLAIQQCFLKNIAFLNLTMGSSGEKRSPHPDTSAVLTDTTMLDPPWDLMNFTGWATKYDSFMDKSVHKTYFTQIYKQISEELGLIPSPLRVHRYLPELFGAIWYTIYMPI